MVDFGNFWIDNNGRNTLKGVPDDPDNPVILPDEYIINALRTSTLARTDWNKMYPALLPEEQERLDNLVAENPYLSQLIRDGTAINDAEMRRFNNIPVYTAGPRGGGGWRRNVQKNTYPVGDDS